MKSTPDRPQGTLEVLLRGYWRNRLRLVAGGLIGLLSAVAYLNFATFYYTAQLQVVPPQSSLQTGNSGMSGLASLAGVSLPGRQVNPFLLYQSALKSRAVADRIAADQTLLRLAFPSRWDARKGGWKDRKEGLGRASDFVKVVLGLPVYSVQPPSGEDLARLFKGRLDVEPDEKSSVTTISFKDKSPQLAARFLQSLHAESDKLLREQVLSQTGGYIAYIEQKLPTVFVVEYRNALTQMLSEQEKLRMMASGQGAFAALPFGSITVSARPTNPDLLVTLFAGLVVGLLAAALYVFLKLRLWRLFEEAPGVVPEAVQQP